MGRVEWILILNLYQRSTLPKLQFSTFDGELNPAIVNSIAVMHCEILSY